MYRYRPDYKIKARHFEDFPHKSKQAAGVMMMLSNNLDYMIAQHPHELITYGGNGAVFQNWAQYLLCIVLRGKNDRRTNISFIFRSSDGIIPIT